MADVVERLPFKLARPNANTGVTDASAIDFGDEPLDASIEGRDTKVNSNSGSIEGKVNTLISVVQTLIQNVVWWGSVPYVTPEELNSQLQLLRIGNGSTVASPVITITGNSCVITCDTTGATIYYTLDGSTPTSSSTQYSSAIILNASCTIQAIAIKGAETSSIASRAYIQQEVEAPVITISGNSASITCATDNATIYYTLDGSTPTSSSTEYIEAISLTQSCTVKAIAIKDNVSSSVASESYAPIVTPIAPTMTLNTSAKTVALSAPSGLTIMYALDNSTPNTTYLSAINVSNGLTVKAISTDGSQSSSVPKITIKYNENGGTVEFVTSETGTIRYTTNGSEPTSGSTEYTSAITAVLGTTYKIAVFDGDTINSEIATLQISA